MKIRFSSAGKTAGGLESCGGCGKHGVRLNVGGSSQSMGKGMSMARICGIGNEWGLGRRSPCMREI